MMVSLRTRLSISYIGIALISSLLISLLVNVFLEGQFRQYVKQNIETANRQLIDLLTKQYHSNGSWNSFNITNIGMNALEQGLIVQLKNQRNQVIWDATKHNNGMCQRMIVHMAQNMTSRYPNWKGQYIETAYPITQNSKRVGTVKIGYYGPFYFKDTDLAFITAINRGLAGVTVVALLMALVIGSLTAQRLSAPIAQVIGTARQIAGGNSIAPTKVNTNIKEINQLAEAINHLGESLQQQEQLRKRLTADMAHELRTPLATVQSHLEAMIDGVWELEVARLKSCHEEIMRIGRMVKALEQLAKYEGEIANLHKTRFDLAELSRQILLNFEPEFRQKGIKLEFFGAEKQLITADRDQLSQVLVNLLSNSLKYTPEGGAIQLELLAETKSVVIKVKDNGIGIAPADLPLIFERFYRADPSRNRLTGGTGIGLAIVKAIVEAHQGTITVQSIVGKGTEFRVDLPIGG